jgi:hypothetical protein
MHAGSSRLGAGITKGTERGRRAAALRVAVGGLAALWMMGCGPTRSSGDPRNARPATVPADAVGAYFSSDESSERWLLVDKERKTVCELPCSQWIAPQSGLTLLRDADAAEDRKAIEVPSMTYPPGSVVDVVIDHPPHTAGFVVVGLGGGGVVIGGVVTLFDALISSVPNLDGSTDEIGPVGPVMMGVGGGTVVVGLALLVTIPGSRAKLEITRLPGAQASVDLAPGVLHVDTATVDVDVTPFGAAGTF